MRYLMLIVIVAVSAVPALAASNYLGGMSGLILTPDHVIVPHGVGEGSFHQTVNVVQGGSFNAWGANYGLAQNLEVGLSLLTGAGENDVALNGKYQMIRENESSPAVLVGVFDVLGMADIVNGNPSIYVLASKNVTPMLCDVSSVPSSPMRLNLGLGSGVYSGVFGGIDWLASDKWRFMLEYTNGEFAGERKLWNAGARYAIADQWRLDAALLKFEFFAFGVNYRTAFD